MINNSSTGLSADWLMSAVKKNPEGLLLLARRRSQRREVTGEFGPGGLDLSLQLVETGFNHD